ncbi:MAG: urea carboxylase [Verrucomicrobiales bacterium]|nr:urea carboxylase [Verrucomicrobiales bacterium]
MMKTLIANRGAIACRIIRTMDRLGFPSVAVYSEADLASRHVEMAGEALEIGPASPRESYLSVEKILAAAKASGAEAIHPGYGFLSENAQFARACELAGLRFVGPTPDQMESFGLKHRAREIARECQVPLLPGTGLLESASQAVAEAVKIGFPVMLKSTAGGGGIGMRVCQHEADLREHFDSVTRLSQSNFKNGGLYVEKFVSRARHIEVQIFGDGCGRVLALGERDCSLQRRNQKVVEETPAPNLDPAVREQLFACARRLGERVHYRSAGTVEFVYDSETAQFYFLEVNTRLQVEHGVTEEVLGIDLVEWMLRLAAGDIAFWPDTLPAPRGHSLQVRIYAENPLRDFQPSTGMLTEVKWPPNTRVETWVVAGDPITPFYDPLVAKLIVHEATRSAALLAMRSALDHTSLSGIETNREYLHSVLAHPDFIAGKPTTALLGNFNFCSGAIEVIDPGAVSTIQDYPGRIGYWEVGLPPSGPMDDLSFRLANRLVGNPVGVPALELTMFGPTLRFHGPARIALTGARVEALLNGSPVSMDSLVTVSTGALLKIGKCGNHGCRTYLAFEGGLASPSYLGSKSTFTLGKLGGPTGNALRAGDMLHLDNIPNVDPGMKSLPSPSWDNHWNLRVIYGPHAAPDYFTPEDIEIFFATRWKVHYNSNPTGVRLIGPKPKWARADGGEAGLHPSNIHDNAYAIGTIDFTGDMPIILGPDGPSLGGFVCPATIIAADRWMMGQLRPGDSLQFLPVSLEEAESAESNLSASIEAGAYVPVPSESKKTMKSVELSSPVLLHSHERPGKTEVKYRPSGDKYLLVEYGPPVLDLDLRFRAHALMNWVRHRQLRGVIDLTPGIRSLQIHYDNRTLPRSRLLDLLLLAEEEIGTLDQLDVPSRIIHMPLSWDDPATRLAIEKYTQSVRPDAPWCPSNIEFIRRINGLASVDEVYRTVFDANYLVLGLGDVYLGAPVATPLDPRHRLVTTKYNPARTWTPENAVGIGGAYMCIYGMEGPGGYQFVGRTVQVWNTWRQTRDFTEGKPWLLRFFDQIRFYPVSADELLRLRRDFPLGRFKLDVEETTFSLKAYHQFLKREAAPIDAFRVAQRKAFAEERERWRAKGQEITSSEALEESAPILEEEIPAGCEAVRTPLTGNLWKILVKPGQLIAAGEAVVIVEAMKMEARISTSVAGRVLEIKSTEGKPVSAGQVLLILDTSI